MGLCMSSGAIDVPQSPMSLTDSWLSQKALRVLWNHISPMELWMSHGYPVKLYMSMNNPWKHPMKPYMSLGAVDVPQSYVPSVDVPRSHLCAMESYVSLGTGTHRCPVEWASRVSMFCGPRCVSWSCRCPGSHPYPTHLWMLHGAIRTPYVSPLWGSSHPQAPFWCLIP